MVAQLDTCQLVVLRNLNMTKLVDAHGREQSTVPNTISSDDVFALLSGDSSAANASTGATVNAVSHRPYRYSWARCDLCHDAVQGIMFTRHPITEKLGDYCCFCLDNARKELAERPEQLMLGV